MSPKKRLYVVNVVWKDDKQETFGRVVWFRVRQGFLIMVNEEGRRMYLNLSEAKRVLVVPKTKEEEEEDFAL